MNNRDSVIAIQGGGILGFALLGQLEAVIEKHGYVPLALAGTSGGAIVAALLWAGFKPSEIRAKFLALSGEDGLTSLLGPFESPPAPRFEYADFAGLVGKLEAIASSLASSGAPHRLGMIGSRLRNCSRKAKTLFQIIRLLPQMKHHFVGKGLFAGEELEEVLNDWICEAFGLPKPDRKNAGRFLTFGQCREKIESCQQQYRPPLLLTATNLTRRRLEIVNSIEDKYADVPVAKAIRASAGFPVFFQPCELDKVSRGGWFADGGMVSNFPMWVFSDVLRKQMSTSDLYRPLASKPWIRIGLRVVDDPSNDPDAADAGAYWSSLCGMLGGGARNELEELLAASAPRSILLEQRRGDTKAPKLILDLGAMKPRAILKMVGAGRRYADQRLKPGFPFWPPWHGQGSRSLAAMQWFSHSAPLATPPAAALSFECCPIMPFQQPQRAFWQQLSRAHILQPVYAGCPGRRC